MPQTKKPTVWILDDQWNSALEKIAFFFSFTDAVIENTNTPEGLDAIGASRDARGWELAALQPNQIHDTVLRNGIVLIDVNWSAAPSSTTDVFGLLPEEKLRYGVTLAKEILSKRQAEDNLDIVLFSHTSGDELTANFFELSRNGVTRLYPVVISQVDSKGLRIRTYGLEARDRITSELLQKLPAETRAEIGSRIQSRQSDERTFVCLDDFTAGFNDLEVDGVRLLDLATPYLKTAEAKSAQAGFQGVHPNAIRESIDHWLSLLIGEKISFEISEQLQNAPTALLKALLRYRKIDHFDGFIHLKDLAGSRFKDPISALKKNLHGDDAKMKHAPLFRSFKHKVSVGLGTAINKVRRSTSNNPLGKSFSPYQKLPEVLKDPSTLDYTDSSKIRKGVKSKTELSRLHILSDGETGFRIEVAKDTVWENSLIEASNRLSRFDIHTSKASELLEMLRIDPENGLICLEIARFFEQILAEVPQTDSRWLPALNDCRSFAKKLQRAEYDLQAYKKFLEESRDAIPRTVTTDFEIDIRGWKERCENWRKQRESIERLLAHFELPDPLGTQLANILETTDTPEGEIALRTFLSSYLPQVRAYARAAIKNTLERNGLSSPTRLKLADRAFAKIFPANDLETLNRNWTTIAISALGPQAQALATMPDSTFCKTLVPSLGKELMQHITGLEGYDFLERLEVIPDDDTQLSEDEDGTFKINAPQADGTSEY